MAYELVCFILVIYDKGFDGVIFIIRLRYNEIRFGEDVLLFQDLVGGNLGQ